MMRWCVVSGLAMACWVVAACSSSPGTGASGAAGRDAGAGTTGGAGADAAAGTGAAGAAAGSAGADEGSAGAAGADAGAGTTGAAGADAAAGTGGAGAAGQDAAATEAGPGDASDASAKCPYKAGWGVVTVLPDTMNAVGQVIPAVGASPAVQQVVWSGVLRAGPTPDQISIRLVSGQAPFASMLAPMSVDLSTQKDFQSCGACVIFSMAFNADASAVLPAVQTFVAVSGTLTVTAVPAFPATATSRFSGTLSNAVFQHVSLDELGMATKVDDCQLALTSLAFDTPVKNQ
jgi:hypothetical protein